MDLPSSTMAKRFIGSLRLARVRVAFSNAVPPFGVELQVHHPFDPVLRDSGVGAGQLFALDQRGTEQVLLGAGSVAGEQRLVGGVDLRVAAVERGEILLVGGAGLEVDGLIGRGALADHGGARLGRHRWCGGQGRLRTQGAPVAGRAGGAARSVGAGCGGLRGGPGGLAPRRSRLIRAGLRLRRRDLLGGVDGPKAQHRGLTDQGDQLVLLDVGHADHNPPVTGGRHLRLADTQAVDPLLDDRLGLLQTGGVHRPTAGGVARGQRHRGPAAQVQAQLGGPGLADRHQCDQARDQDREHDQGPDRSPSHGRHVCALLRLLGGTAQKLLIQLPHRITRAQRRGSCSVSDDSRGGRQRLRLR